MATLPIYLERYAYQKPQIAFPASDDLAIIVVIPCFNEPDIFEALNSIRNCHQPACCCEVIVVINHGENADPSIKKVNTTTFEVFRQYAFKNNSNWLKFHAIYAADLPTKDAGVGLARKIGMDEAVWRFEYAGNPKGIIANFDADCTCDSNYLTRIISNIPSEK